MRYDREGYDTRAEITLRSRILQREHWSQSHKAPWSLQQEWWNRRDTFWVMERKGKGGWHSDCKWWSRTCAGLLRRAWRHPSCCCWSSSEWSVRRVCCSLFFSRSSHLRWSDVTSCVWMNRIKVNWIENSVVGVWREDRRREKGERWRERDEERERGRREKKE